jgi:hypothetical protein
MLVPIHSFELHVKPEPLEKGLALFEQSTLELMRNAGNGKIEAVVHDGELVFHPVLIIKGDSVIEASCDCGQAKDTICRHGVAMLFRMSAGDFKEGVVSRTGKMPVEVAPPKPGRPKPEAKKKAAPKEKAPKPVKPPKTVADILEMLPKEAIVAFLLAECKASKLFALKVKAQFGDLLPCSSPDDLQKRIEESIKAVGKYKNRPLKNQIDSMGKAFQNWLDEGIRYANLGDLDMSLVVLRLLTPRIPEWLNQPNFPEDTRKEILTKLVLLIDLLEKQSPESAHRNDVFQCFLNLQGAIFLNGKFIFLNACINLCVEQNEFDKLEKLIKANEYEPNSPYWGLHHTLVAKVKGKAAGDKFLQSNKQVLYFRLAKITELVDQKDFDAALALIPENTTKEQLKADKHYTSLGYWLKIKDNILLAKGDLPGRIRNAFDLLATGEARNSTMDEIAASVALEEWVAARAVIVAELEKKGRISNLHKIATLFQALPDLPSTTDYMQGLSIKELAQFAEAISSSSRSIAFREHCLKHVQDTFVKYATESIPMDRPTSSDLEGCFRGLMGWEAWGKFIKGLGARFPNYGPIQDILRAKRTFW